MPDLFLDTAGWGQLVDPTQSYHKVAARIYRVARQQKHLIVTTNYVIAELVALLTSPLHIPRRSIIAFIEGLRTSPYVRVVLIDSALEQQAWEFLKAHPDKDWSLVDCASFVVMKQRGIQEALTSDHHFEQAGFVRLLKA